VRLFEASTGHLLYERNLHKPEAGRLLEPDNTGVSLAFGSASDLYALTNGHTVRRIDSSTGELLWGWSAPDQTYVMQCMQDASALNAAFRSLNIYTSVHPTPSAIYLIGLAKSFASYTLHIISLSPLDGSLLASVDVPSSIEGGPSSILVLSNRTAGIQTARTVWLEAGQIKSVGLTPDLKDKPSTVKSAVYHQLVDADVKDHGLFVALKEDGAARIIRLNEDGTGLNPAWDFADSVRNLVYLLPVPSSDHLVGPYCPEHAFNLQWWIR
jgi:ER membrane protein complex subunit 1